MAYVHDLHDHTRHEPVPTPTGRGNHPTTLVAVVATAALAAHGSGVDLSYGGLARGLRDLAARDPVDALAVTVLGGSLLFYLAEVGHNPKVSSFTDALLFVSTNLSVGYADVFAKTKAGKAIASAIMSLGPAVAARALDAPGVAEPSGPRSERALAVQAAILEKLELILQELRSTSAPAKGA